MINCISFLEFIFWNIKLKFKKPYKNHIQTIYKPIKMYSNIIRAIPFSRISQVLTPDITKIPVPILREISEKFITPEMISQVVIRNNQPLIIVYLSFRELFKNSKSIAEYEPLHKRVKSILVQGYFRDISTCYIPEKQMVINRIWFDYNRETRLIKFVNVYELCNDSAWCVDTQRYLTMIRQHETVLSPSFNNDHIASNNDNGFIKKLQVMV